ncbi:MAG: lysophospholipid acyltransferase family protein [Planctomycetota bacterium]
MQPYRFWRWVCWLIAKPFFRLTSEGHEHIPASGPVVLVPNHSSFLDPPFAGISCHRTVRFMARSTLAHNRVLGWWMRQVGVILIDRNAPARATFDESIRILSAGEVMAVFPEGTRTPDGRLQEFKKGILKLLDKTGAIAVPTGIIGSFEAWPRHRKLPRPHRCHVRFGPPMSAAEVCAPGGLDRLRQAVAALSGQELAPIAVSGTGAGAPPRSFASDSPPPRDAASAG